MSDVQLKVRARAITVKAGRKTVDLFAGDLLPDGIKKEDLERLQLQGAVIPLDQPLPHEIGLNADVAPVSSLDDRIAEAVELTQAQHDAEIAAMQKRLADTELERDAAIEAAAASADPTGPTGPDAPELL